jgi:hypothetical protein
MDKILISIYSLIVVTPINQDKKSNSYIDYIEQLNRKNEGNKMMWDDTSGNKQQVGGLFIFQENKTIKREGCVRIHLVEKVYNPEHRLESWYKNVGQHNRNVLVLSNKFIKLDWNKWMELGGPKKVQGTQHIIKNKSNIIDYVNNRNYF